MPMTPDWVQDAIFYQIFPDRFASSLSITKPHNLEPWDSPPTTLGFKGGDLMGLVEHLDHLIDLGINALYLNPIFQSTANHRYHTHDYYQVDPILGGNKTFKALLDAAHARGIRIILDGVFNHASRGLLQFNHALENGAASPYLDWFTFHGFPVHAYHGKPNFDCWYGLPALPKFNHGNPQVREFILRVAEHWVAEGIDGWRLDVPEEVSDDAFWIEFRRRIKRLNPDAYIVGEIWHRADGWLRGDQFDAVMNYQFTRACLSFLIQPNLLRHNLSKADSYGPLENLDARGFASRLEELLTWYPRQIAYSQLNLLDSHDTARFMTVAGGDASALKLAWLVMFAYPGAPMIYYGDEIGMQGGNDPECRGSFLWDRSFWDYDLLNTAKRLTKVRNRYKALRRGKMKTLLADGSVYVFLRELPEEKVIVGCNAGTSAATIDLKVHFGEYVQEEWTGEQIRVKEGMVRGMQIAPRTGSIWVVH